MKQLLKLRQVLFCALFLHGLCKTNIVKVLYVKKCILCKTYRHRYTCIYVYAYLHIYNFCYADVGRQVLRNMTTLSTRHLGFLCRAHCQLHRNGDPHSKKHLSSTITAVRHQSTSKLRASSPKEGDKEPVQELFSGRKFSPHLLGIEQMCACLVAVWQHG